MVEQVLLIVKFKLGISTTVRDTFLLQLIQSNLNELRHMYGIQLNENSDTDIDFVADWVVERYQNKEYMSNMLKSRFHTYLLMRGKKDVEQ